MIASRWKRPSATKTIASALSATVGAVQPRTSPVPLTTLDDRLYDQKYGRFLNGNLISLSAAHVSYEV